MITINLPWPPKETSANASGQGKWRAKSDAAKAYKHTCAWLLMAAKVRPVAPGPVTVSVTFNPTNQTSRFDLDNLLGRAKQGLDAVAEAIGIDDADWTEMRLIRGKKDGAGSITVHVAPFVPPSVNLPLCGSIS